MEKIYNYNYEDAKDNPIPLKSLGWLKPRRRKKLELEKACIRSRKGNVSGEKKGGRKTSPMVSIGPAPSGSTGIEGIEGITPAFSYTDMAEY